MDESTDVDHAIRAVIFDLDGTITRPYLDFNRIRAEIGIRDRRPILEAMETMAPAQRAAAERIVERHETEAATNSELYDGARELLDGLRRAGIRTALMTRNSRRSVETVLAKHGLAFDWIRTREDGPIKPSPEPVLAICRALGVPVTDTLVVGDYLYDIQSGAAAGARTVLMTGDAEPPPFLDQADHVVRSLAELAAIIDGTAVRRPRTP